jgi:hypothetical protein
MIGIKMKKIFVVLILFSLLLSGCGTFEIYLESTPVADSTIVPASAATVVPTLSLNSTSEEIQHAMLESATKWKSIWMDGTVTNYTLDGTNSATTTREQVWIDLLKNRFRVVIGPADGAAHQFLTSDGTTILKMDLKTGQSQSSPMPEFAQARQFVPTLEPGTAYPQPLWGQMGTPLSEMAFASDFAQNQGTFKPVGTESVADRQALVVEWTYAQSNQPSWRLWLDNQTAVILKMQSFSKAGGDTIQSESILNNVSFDDVFADLLFGMPSSVPQFSDITGQSESAETGTNIPSGRDALGELYFFESPRQNNPDQSAHLVRMPGQCVVGEMPCPQLESVTLPFPMKFGLPIIEWSPDGKLAAIAYSDNANGTPYKLWIFDPAANTWTSIWEHAYIDPPMWSPDGKWIAFRQQDGVGGEDIMAIRPDGSDPKNLTAGGNLSAVSLPYVIDGWITGNIIARTGKYGTNDTVYLIRVPDAHVQPMFEKTLTKAVLVPSSDGMWIAYDDYDNSSLKHSLKVEEPDGANAVELASFTGGTLYPIVWSPDNRTLAFAYYTEITQGSQTADVYVIDRNGKGLKQVYKGSTVGAVLFSPDGKNLIINETSSATGGRLFVVNLDTLEQRLIQSPGLTLDSDWFMPSWRE